MESAHPKIKKGALAKKLGKSPAAISHWFSGKRECPTQMVRRIAAITNVDPSWLLLGKGVGPRPAHEDDRPNAANVRLRWHFRPTPADGGKDFGNAGVYATPTSIGTVVREDGQNSLDAGLGDRVTMRFRVIELSPGSDRHTRFLRAIRFEQLEQHIDGCKSESKIGNRLVAGLEHLREEKLVLLAIDDYGTTGLYGDEFDSNSPFCALVRDNLNSRKSDTTSGGVFGVGAKVNLACSRVGTVLYASTIQDSAERVTRLIGRSELTFHQVSERHREAAYAGPGWLGGTGTTRVAKSVWLPEDHETLSDLFLRRDKAPTGVPTSNRTGTTVLIVAFVDPQVDLSSGTKQLADSISEAVAVNFWPAIMNEQLTTIVERYVDDDVPTSAEVVDPRAVAGVAAYCDAFEKFDQRQLRPSLAHPGDVVATDVSFIVPATRPNTKQVAPHEELSAEAKLVVRLAQSGDSRADAKVNNVAFVRGRAMVTRYQNKSNALVGGRSFHAVLLAGTMVGRTSEQLAAEEYLRLAEPPAHDRWQHNADVAEVYARGSKRLLDDFLVRVTEQLQHVLRPIAAHHESGPEALSKLFILRDLRQPAQRRVKAWIKSATGAVKDGAWHVEGEVSIEATASPLLLTPTVAFEQEGGRYSIRWSELELVEGVGEKRDGSFILPPRTKVVRFRGRSDPTSHPVDASESAVLVDVLVTPAK